MPERSSPREEHQVQVAKISAFQAIIVATITAVAGLLAGYLGKPMEHNQDVQRWLVIDGAEAKDHSLIRIVATVNGVYFSYPSNSVWTAVGPDMSRERFPLPSSKNYSISFRAFLSDPGPAKTIQGESNYVDTIQEFPSGQRTYQLYPSEGSYRGASPGLSVRYHVE
jgi:hypothetical protein